MSGHTDFQIETPAGRDSLVDKVAADHWEASHRDAVAKADEDAKLTIERLRKAKTRTAPALKRSHSR